MGDIAAAAGMSRPTLYLVFPGKEEIFAAVIYQMNDDFYALVQKDLTDLPNLEAKLRYVCEKWGAHGYDIVESHPDAKDLFDLNFAPVQHIYNHFHVFLAALIADAVPQAKTSATAAELARVLAFAMRGFKDTATSGADMRRLIAVQVSLLVATLDLDGGK